MGPFHLGGSFFFFIGWLLLLLVTLSVPIIKSIYLFQIGVNETVGISLLSASAQAAVNFGVFGWCSVYERATAAGINIVNKPAECSGRHLGYTITPAVQDILSAINEQDLVNVINKGLTVVLVLHPIACGLAFVAFAFALFSGLRPAAGRVSAFLATAIGALAAFLTTIVFIIDCVLTGVAKSRIHSKTSGAAYAKFGNAEWITLGAAIATWIGVVASCCGIFRSRREAKRY